MLATCPCQKCGMQIEFDVEHANQFIDCPHCQQRTRLLLSNLPVGFAQKKPAAGALKVPFAAKIVSLVFLLLAILVVAAGDFENKSGVAGLFIWLAILSPIYFLPTMIARQHRRKNSEAIFVLNLFAGWTFIGWVAAIVWANVKD